MKNISFLHTGEKEQVFMLVGDSVTFLPRVPDHGPIVAFLEKESVVIEEEVEGEREKRRIKLVDLNSGKKEYGLLDITSDASDPEKRRFFTFRLLP